MTKQDITTLWKNLAANKLNTSVHHIQYCVLLAMASKSEDKLAVAKHLLRKAFSPVRNPMKLANGCEPFQVLNNNRWALRTTLLLGKPESEFLTADEIKLYRSLIEQVTPRALIRNYSYFFTRQDIFDEYQLVQTAHVALELGAKLRPEQVKDLHFTCCAVPDLQSLEDMERVLKSMLVDYVVFREPDIGNEMTSIGVYPLEEHKRGLLRNYPLLRFNRKPIVMETVNDRKEVEPAY